MSDPLLRASSRRRFLQSVARGGVAAPLATMPAAAFQEPAPGSRPVVPSLGPAESALAFAGDLFLTHAFPDRLAPATEQVYDVMRDSAASFANLENGLSTVGSAELGGYRWGGALRGHPSLVKELTRAGVDVVSTANNHTCNFGREALLETLATLDNAKILHAGGGRNIDAAFSPARVAANGLKIAFFSLYSCHYNRVSQEMASAHLPGVAGLRAYDVLLEMPGFLEERNVPPNIFPLRVNPAVSMMAPLREDVQRLGDAIRKKKADADIVVLYVHFHWARHTKADLPYHQRIVAHAAIDAGVDIFVGHGPHTLRGIELYRGKPVLFSIGNFVLQRQAPGRVTASTSHGHQSVVARVAVRDKRLTRLELLPIWIGSDGQPQFTPTEIGHEIVHRLSGLSAEFGTELAARQWYAALDLEGNATSRTADA